MSTFVEPIPQVDSMSESYPHADSKENADSKANADSKLDANSRCRLRSIWIHLIGIDDAILGASRNQSKQPYRSTQALEGVPRGLFHNEATGDTRRLHQDEGIPFLPRRSSERLALPTADHVQHMRRHEAHVLGEILPGVQDRDHLEGNL
ncbi:hypothetical protein CR513_11906, partial [Mucuna pruriens]